MAPDRSSWAAREIEREQFGHKFVHGAYIERENPHHTPRYNGRNVWGGNPRKKLKTWWQAACEFRDLETTGTVDDLQQRLGLLSEAQWVAADQDYEDLKETVRNENQRREQLRVKKEVPKLQKAAQLRKQQEAEGYGRQMNAWTEATTDEERCRAFPYRFLAEHFGVPPGRAITSSSGNPVNQQKSSTKATPVIVLKNAASNALLTASGKLGLVVRTIRRDTTPYQQASIGLSTFTIIAKGSTLLWREETELRDMWIRETNRHAAEAEEIKTTARAVEQSEQNLLLSRHYHRIITQKQDRKSSTTTEKYPSIAGNWTVYGKEPANFMPTGSHSDDMIMDVTGVDEWSEDELDNTDEIEEELEQEDHGNIVKKASYGNILQWCTKQSQTACVERYKAAFSFNSVSGVMRIEAVRDNQGTLTGIYRWRGRAKWDNGIQPDIDSKVYPITFKSEDSNITTEAEFLLGFSQPFTIIGLKGSSEHSRPAVPATPWLHLGWDAFKYESQPTRTSFAQHLEERRHNKV